MVQVFMASFVWTSVSLGEWTADFYAKKTETQNYVCGWFYCWYVDICPVVDISVGCDSIWQVMLRSSVMDFS